MFDFHSIAVPDEISLDVVVASQYQACCCSPNMSVTIVVQTTSQLSFGFLCSIGFDFLLCLFADVGHHSTLFSLTEILE
jgi:hypothetical protein